MFVMENEFFNSMSFSIKFFPIQKMLFKDKYI